MGHVHATSFLVVASSGNAFNEQSQSSMVSQGMSYIWLLAASVEEQKVVMFQVTEILFTFLLSPVSCMKAISRSFPFPNWKFVHEAGILCCYWVGGENCGFTCDVLEATFIRNHLCWRKFSVLWTITIAVVLLKLKGKWITSYCWPKIILLKVLNDSHLWAQAIAVGVISWAISIALMYFITSFAAAYLHVLYLCWLLQ